MQMREALTVRGNRKRGAPAPVSRAGSGSTPKQSAWSKLLSMIRGQRLRRINATDEEIEAAWSMHYDEVMDKWFWYNDITEESSWAEDEDDEEGEGASGAGAVADSGQGGSRHVGDWEERIHPSNGMKYYVNKVLRKQQWEMPACFSDQGVGHWEPRRHPTAQAWFYLNTVTGQVRTDVPPEVEARDPQHKYAWEEKVHPQNGKRYYVNLVTRKQQWTRPAGLDEGASVAVSTTTPTALATSTVGSAPEPAPAPAPAPTPEFHTSNPMVCGRFPRTPLSHECGQRQARYSELSSQVQPNPVSAAVSASHDSYEEEDAEDTNSEQTPAVPAEVGWIKSLDPTSGSYYWFHTGTGESKWIDSESESGSEDDWSATSDDASMTRGTSPV